MNKELISIFILTLLIAGILSWHHYWYNVRPIKIRSTCHEEAYNKAYIEPRGLLWIDEDSEKDYDRCYKECLERYRLGY